MWQSIFIKLPWIFLSACGETLTFFSAQISILRWVARSGEVPPNMPHTYNVILLVRCFEFIIMGATSWNQRWLSVIGSVFPLSICVKWAKCVSCARRIRRGRANEQLCEHVRGLYMQMVEFPRQTSKYDTIPRGLLRSLLTTPDIKLFFGRTQK